MRKILIALAVLFANSFAYSATAQTPTASANQSGDQVIRWNRILLEIVRTPSAPGAKPSTVDPTRNFAIVHAAIYDAVNAINNTHSVYLVRVDAPRKASPEAAVAAAAHDTLSGLYPKQKKMLDARLVDSLAQIPDSPRKVQGIRVGQEVARRILALRSKDGSDAQPRPYVAGTKPGDYQRTPPNFSAPVFTHWPRVRPFTLTRANQFRPDPPPALTSAEYTAAFQEVKELGSKNSTTRSADQTESAKFWGGKIQNYWNEIAQTAALSRKNTLAQNARLFALLNLALADDAIAVFEAKYTYNFWRPVTAIHAADKDNNPDTTAELNWTPLADTPPNPAYPGGHSGGSTSSAVILSSFFGGDDFNFVVRSETSPGVVRTFNSFTAAAEDAGLSRIYIGHHFRTDHIASQKQGSEIGKHVFKKFLVARRNGAPAGLPNTGLGNNVPSILAVLSLLVVAAGFGIRRRVRRHSTR